MSKKSKEKQKLKEEDGVLYVSIVEARNLSAMDKKGTSNPYCVVKNTFNKQSFKTSTIKKTLTPTWDQTFKFYTSSPSGHIIVRLWDKGRWSSDDFLGETAISLKGLMDGNPSEEWHELSNEPKKNKNKDPNKPPGEVRIKLHFPVAGKTDATEDVSNKSEKKKKKAGPKSNNIEDLYVIGKELGRGGFSVVKEATNKETGEKVAVKIIEKTASADELNLLHREIDIMKKLQHKNIIELVEVFQNDDNIYLVLELVTGGELFDQIVTRGSYSENDAAAIVKQILEAVEYMHSNGIAHRDLKPENLLVSGENGEHIKVTDFGLSKDFGEATLQTSCGTPDYVAPEVLRGAAYDNSVDIWSLGVITYILLCGFPPFYGNTDQEIFEKILKADYDFPDDGWESVSDDAKEFIKSILILDNSKRPTAEEALQHPWMVGNAPSTALQTFKKDTFEKYNQKLRKARGKK